MSVLSDRLAPARLFLVVVAVWGTVVVQKLADMSRGSGEVLSSFTPRWMTLIVGVQLVSLLALATVLLLSTSRAKGLETGAARSIRALSLFGKLNWLAVLVVWLVYVWLVYHRYETQFNRPDIYPWFFLFACGVGTLFAAAAQHGQKYGMSFIIVVVAYAAGVTALGFMPQVTSFPFSLSWSEASRYYYASLPYSRQLFGMDIPLSPWHPSRYLMLSAAYWIPQAPLWAHRLWQVLLWLGMSALGGAVLARRVTGKDRSAYWVITGWSLMFLLQGPVYYQLMVCVVLVLWGFDLSRPKKTLFFLVLASVWAGISRINWVPVPAMIAISLYLLEQPVCAARKLWDYVTPGLVWGGVGVAVALASQAAYIPLSGNEDVSKFGSSFTSDLLWYRLLPNPTYPLGVLLAITIVTLPLLTLIVVNWVRGRAHWHPLRLTGLVLILGVLLAAGLVVSTKIGGGSNIHNLDAFIVMVNIVGGYIVFGRFASETGIPAPRVWRPWPMITAILFVTILWSLNIGSPFSPRDFAQAEIDLNKMNAIMQQYAQEDQEVLFITQRQLLIFDITPGVRMVPEYELLTLSEMAISNNQPYLQRFAADLQNHRFDLIVADRQHNIIRDPKIDGFAEENNAWVVHVAAPLLKYYKSILHLEYPGVDLMVPKE